jgi:hypothetical protein
VYEIENVRKQCLDLLRKEGRTLSTAEISQALVIPLWAVESGMDSARRGRLANHTAGAGWTLASAKRPAVDQEEQFQAAQGGLL